MMETSEISAYALAALARAGAQEGQCSCVSSEKHSLSFENGKFSLLRTARDTSLELLAIKDSRRGAIKIDRTGRSEISRAIDQMVAALPSAPQDPAYALAPAQPAGTFDNGVSMPDREKIFDRLNELREHLYELYPDMLLRQAGVEFLHETRNICNSNGVNFSCAYGSYHICFEAALSEAGHSLAETSFNVVAKDLDRPLWTYGGIEEELARLAELRGRRRLEGEFVGDVLIAPAAFREFVKFFTVLSLRDMQLIPGTSPYKDKKDRQIAAKEFTLRSSPLSEELSEGYFVTADAFRAENIALIEEGILKNFMPSYYGARKLGIPYVPTSGGCCIVDAGAAAQTDLVRCVKKGLLVGEFCEDRPNERGDFSGLAKNSFYIEDGRVKFPVAEVLISGNIPQMMLNLKGISRERVNFGDAVYPWMSFGGITISGK